MFEKSFPQFSSQINDLLVEAHDRHIGINNAVQSSCCIQRHIDTSMGSGVGIQAITQLQEQTLSFGIKLIAVCITLFLTAGWFSNELLRFSQNIFDHFFMLQ